MMRFGMALLVLAGALFAQPTISCFQRTLFISLPATASNPFWEIKVAATFQHGLSSTLFKMPVVCTQFSGTTATFEVVFTPNLVGPWTWWIAPGDVVTTSGAIVDTSDAPSPGNPKSFNCIASSLKGWWRPDIATPGAVTSPSGQYPHALVEPKGDGSFSYVRSAQTTYFNMANPQWPANVVTAALSWPGTAGINRLRFALTSVDDRAQAPATAGAPHSNHTVFLRTGPDYTSGSIDFTRFDLGVWANIDNLVAAMANLSLQASVILAFNSGTSDNEEKFFDNRNVFPTSSFSPIPATGSAFSYHHEFYLWYAVGRLGAYPNVHWCTMHEWNNQTYSVSDARPYPVATARAIGMALHNTDPYLTSDANAKIVNTCPARGSFYAGTGDFNRLSFNESAFLTTMDDTWRSCIGLHRGGELGITSIVSQTAATRALESARNGYPCSTSKAHRYELVTNNTDRPILIEEDWISRNDPVNENVADLQPYVAASFANQDNPYARYRGQSPNVSSVGNQACFPFITNNFSGLRKAIRDSAWMAGVVCQTHTSYWTRKYGNLSELIASRSADPYRVILKRWTNVMEWWRFRYDANLVTQQSLLAALPSVATALFSAWPPQCSTQYLPLRLQGTATNSRLPHEQLAIGAKSDHGGAATQYIAYCPVGMTNPTPSTVATLTLNLTELSAGTAFTYYFVNPDNGYRSPVAAGVVPPTSTLIAFPAPPQGAIGEFGEYVLLVNCP